MRGFPARRSGLGPGLRPEDALPAGTCGLSAAESSSPSCMHVVRYRFTTKFFRGSCWRSEIVKPYHSWAGGRGTGEMGVLNQTPQAMP